MKRKPISDDEMREAWKRTMAAIDAAMSDPEVSEDIWPVVLGMTRMSAADRALVVKLAHAIIDDRHTAMQIKQQNVLRERLRGSPVMPEVEGVN